MLESFRRFLTSCYIGLMCHDYALNLCFFIDNSIRGCLHTLHSHVLLYIYIYIHECVCVFMDVYARVYVEFLVEQVRLSGRTKSTDNKWSEILATCHYGDASNGSGKH